MLFRMRQCYKLYRRVHEVAEENDGVELRERERHGQYGGLSGEQVGPQRRVLDEVLREKLRGRARRRGGLRERRGHVAYEVDAAPEDARAAEPRGVCGQRAVLGVEELQSAARCRRPHTRPPRRPASDSEAASR